MSDEDHKNEPTEAATAPVSGEPVNTETGKPRWATPTGASSPGDEEAVALAATGGLAPKTGGVPYGRYQLLRKIATGGMAQLYLATMKGEADFQKLCVVKKILPHLAEQAHFVNMFLDEARIAATLEHPNIVHIFDLGKVGSSYFISMEYISGEDLSHLQKRAARDKHELPIELCCRVVADLCAGLHYAHDQRGLDGQPLNIVHRDVSPQNVIVTYSGQVKIVDFGIAKAANKAAHTRTGTIMGKSAYMSPEQCLGQTLDRRSDVFAVGILLFELLTGRRLFKRENELLTMRAITEEGVPEVGDYRANLPEALEEIVSRALQRDREERFASALEMREALEGFIAQFGVPATSLELAGLLEDLFPDHIERQSRVREAGSISEVIAALPSTGIKDLGTPSANQVNTLTGTGERPARTGLLWGLLSAAAVVTVAAVVALFLRPTPAGELVLTTTPPGAEVRLDGELRGEAPLALEALKLDHAYLLEVSASGYTAHSENLILTRERSSQELRLVLEREAVPAVGIIVVETDPPGAQVSLNGNDTGQVTPARFEDVAADLEHEVALQLDGYQDETRRVLLRGGAEQKVTLTLSKQEKAVPSKQPPKVVIRRPKPAPTPSPTPKVPVVTGTGFLTLRTSPWTRVSHGKVDLGDTPLFKLELPAGKVKLRLVNAAKGIDTSITVTIDPGKVTTVDRRL